MFVFDDSAATVKSRKPTWKEKEENITDPEGSNGKKVAQDAPL